MFTALFAWSALNASWDAVRTARDQTDIARNAYLASTRAWINVSVDTASVSLTWDKAERPIIKATLKGTNEGNLPAIDVQIFPVLFLPQSGKTEVIRNRIKTLCSGIPIFGTMVFMKDSFDQTVITGLQSELIKEWLDRIWKYVTRDQPIPVPLSVTACAAYRIVGDSITHHTARIYTVGKAPSATMVAPFFGEDLASGQVILWREYDGEYAD